MVRFGPFKMDLDTEELWNDGRRVPLAPKPSEGLAHLVQRSGSLVRREELYETLWSTTVVELDQGLNSVVRQIRAALGDDASAPRYVETVPRKGYRFIARVEPHLEESDPPPRHPAWAGVAAGVVLVAVAGFMLALQTPGFREMALADGQAVPAEYTRWTEAARHLLAEETRQDARRALSILDSLLVRYPNHSAPRADRAHALLRLGRPIEARADLDWALSADSASGRSWNIHGTLLLREWRLPEALDAFRRAVALEPRVPSHHHSFGYALALSGDHEAAGRAMDRALDLSPLSPAVHGDAGLFERWAGRLDDAESRCREALRLVEARWLVRPHRCLLQVASARGNLAEMRVHATQMLLLAGLNDRQVDDIMTIGVGLDGYWAWARKAENLTHAQGFNGPYAAALAAADAGDEDAALVALEEALDTRQPGLIQVGAESRLTALRGKPQFERIRDAVLGTSGPQPRIAARRTTE